ncbi:hypothetical protein [Kitasatospora viridis]|uniref:Uncharacterized protein n=1 Tax=Kitasatospora viridis TaxID=281105 RepID=A0A561UL91_9ACTN|nr:hypothetical protein [Kitasatospora viridis]TWG00132.1 hypothetical protein FHX73_114001 [Kitasatospora viridis]
MSINSGTAEEIRAEFAAQGVPVVVRGAIAFDTLGRSYGLAVLDEELGRLAGPGTDRADLIRAHVRSLLEHTTGPSELDAAPRADLLGRLYPLLVGSAALAEGEEYLHAPEPLPGLREFLALRVPDGLSTLSAQGVAKLGNAHELRARARANLLALPIERHELADGTRGGEFHVLSGLSVLTASRILVLEQLFEQLTGRPVPDKGLLAAVPSAQELLFAPVDDHIASVFGTMLRYRALPADQQAAELSPHVYWWRGGQLTPQTAIGPGGRLRVAMEAEFAFTAAPPAPVERRHHHYQFAHRALPAALRAVGPELVTDVPVGGLTPMLVELWGEVGARLPPDQRVSWDGLECEYRRFGNGHTGVFVTLPPPVAPPEAHLAAAVLPSGGDELRYFTVEFAIDPVTREPGAVLGEWTTDGTHRLLSTGAAAEPDAFAAAVSAVLDGERRRGWRRLFRPRPR